MSKISEIARSYEFQREVSPNKSFVDPTFLAKMKAVGWKAPDAWCAYFAELVWKEATQNVLPFSASAWQTFLKYEKARGKKNSAVPIEGALVVWRVFKNGLPQAQGHIGIVVGVQKDHFETIEGNTTDKGGREGVMVAYRKRHFEWERDNGLRLMGFIHPA